MFRQGKETEERAIRRVVNEYEKKKKMIILWRIYKSFEERVY